MEYKSDTHWLLVLVVMCHWILAVSGAEYCSTEVFNATCPTGHVVMATRASYGRMKLGRCVQSEMGHLGCEDDVLNIVDGSCSGRRSCVIRVPDQRMNKQSPCSSEVTKYLDAEYICEKVITPRREQCRSSVTIDASTHGGNLASIVSTETGCGIYQAYWIIEVAPGQQIQLTLKVFSWDPQAKFRENSRDCETEYGFMIDLETENKKTFCRVQANERHRQEYTTSGPRVQVVLNQDAVNADTFLIQFQAVGCPDIVRQAHSWVRRDGNEVVVGCEAAKQQWHLTCLDNRWHGVIGNCSQYVLGPQSANAISDGSSPFETGSAILIVIGVAILLCCIIVTIGVIYLRRMPKEDSRAPMPYHYPVIHRYGEDMYQHKSDEYKETYSDNSNAYSRNEYTHIWDQPFVEDTQSEMSLPPPPHSTPITTHVLSSFCPITAPFTSTESGVNRDMRLSNQMAPRVRNIDSGVESVHLPLEDATSITT